MGNITELFNGIQLASVIAIIAFVIYYFAYRKDLKELQREQLKGKRK
jgi:hypothetical protein